MPANSRPAVEIHEGCLSLSVQPSSCITLSPTRQDLCSGPHTLEAPLAAPLPTRSLGPNRGLSLDCALGAQVLENSRAESSEGLFQCLACLFPGH